MRKLLVALLLAASAFSCRLAFAQNALVPGSQPFSCFVENVTATTLCTQAPTGMRAFIGGVFVSNEAATAQTIDIVYGTGSACGTGTVAITNKMNLLATAAGVTAPPTNFAFQPAPAMIIVPAPSQQVCTRPTAATAFGATLTGFFAP